MNLLPGMKNKKNFLPIIILFLYRRAGKQPIVLQQPGTKKYWIGGNKGLAVFDRQTNQLSYKGHNVAKEPVIDKFGDIPGPTRLFIDKQQRLWFDAWLGLPLLFCYDLKKKEPVLDHYSFLPID